MSVIIKPIKWFYHEFGIASIHETGRDAYLLIAARTLRMFAYGTNSLILAIFFAALKFNDHQIGLFMTLTLLGDVFLGTYLTLIADRVGRRKVLVAGSLLMISSGLVFAIFENFWLLLLAAIFGVISVTGGDFGPFRSIEESVISQLTSPTTRADVLAWYVTTSTLGSSLGSEASGRIIHYLQERDGWTEVDAYHALFWIYAATGVLNVVLTLLLSKSCELPGASTASTNATYSQIPQADEESNASPAIHDSALEPETVPPSITMTSTLPPLPNASRSGSTSRLAKIFRWFRTTTSSISPSTLSIMYKLWFLLSVDSLADGMVPYSLTNYFMDDKFHPSKSTLGDIQSLAYFLGAIGSAFAGPLARHIGLINTMVFTHVPSSAAVLIFAVPGQLWLTAILLLVRAGLNNMDQAPRSAFIAAVVRPEERTAVMGITSMLRTVAAMGGPLVTGALAAKGRFWVAFVVAGVCRLAYDFGLYAMFVNMKIEGDRGKGKSEGGPRKAESNDIVGGDGGNGDVEMQRFSLDSTSSEEEDWKGAERGVQGLTNQK